MYDYNRRRKIGPATILFLFLFSGSLVGLAVISYLDRGRFWDVLPYFSVPIIVLSLILAIYNLVRRCNAGFLFILFFIIFTIGLVLSSVFGPFALRREALGALEEEDYQEAIEKLDSILEEYPSSRYAEESLRSISFAYYYDNMFPEALDSFDRAVEKDVIDEGQLEIMDIYQDIYFHMAQKDSEKGRHLEAARGYQNSVSILKKIKSGFPDTNEAFIAQYKIPQYLFYASEEYRETGDTASRIQLLEEIMAEHPESDQYQEAASQIDEAYVDRAMELSASGDHEQAIGFFLRYLDSSSGIKEGALFDYRVKMVFEDAPASLIRKTADAALAGGQHYKAALLYEILVQYNPYYLGRVKKELVRSKVRLAEGLPHDEILQPEGRYIDLPGWSRLTIINSTGYDLYIYLMGTEEYHETVSPGEPMELEVAPGEYTMLVEPEEDESLPELGDILFEEYRTYSLEVKAPAEGEEG